MPVGTWELRVSRQQSLDNACEVAARHAAHGDRHRELHPEVLEAIIGAGFTRGLVPARWGGAEQDFTGLTESVVRLGANCASAAWLASLFAYSARFGAYLPEAGQGELWAKGADTVVAAALVPSGRAVLTPEGWSLSGQWPYSSGIQHADWAFVCVKAETPDGPDTLYAAVPRSGYTTVDTWSTLGMRATGSHTLVLADTIVPEHLVFRSEALMRGESVGASGPVYRVPLRAIGGITFAAPLIGAARGALHDHVSTLRKPPGPEVAHAAGEIDAAELLLLRAAERADQGQVGPPEVARAMRDAALAADFARTAVDRLIRAAGTGGQADDRPAQRFWRDLNTGSSHIALRFELASAPWTDHLPTSKENHR